MPQPVRYALPNGKGGYEFFDSPDEPMSKAEVLAKRTEELYHQMSSQRRPEQEEHTNPHARLGRPLHHSEFVHRLRRLIPTLALREGQPGNIALYRPTPNGDALVYLGYLYKGDNPEYSTWLLNEWDVPVQERRGWRTTLLRLILNSTLTEQQVNQVFPRPSNGATASAYRRHLYRFRNPNSTRASQLGWAF
jgi:hypothetical protein